MARPLRIEFPGAYYHLTARGNAREDIYHDDTDRGMFLQLLGEVCERFGWRVYAWCLMSNHYHLVVQTPGANLSRGMRHLNGVYTQRFNRRHRRVGHVYQGRYKAIIIDQDDYLLEAIRYVLLNPVRAGMVKTAGLYSCSSYRHVIGRLEAPHWLAVDPILSHFSTSRSGAGRLFIRFVQDGTSNEVLWQRLRNLIYLGDEKFVESIQQQIAKPLCTEEIPAAHFRRPPQPLAEYVHQYPAKVAMRRAYASGCYTLKSLADYFGLHYSTVSRIVKKCD